MGSGIVIQNDTRHRPIPAFIPDAAKSQSPITGTYVFKFGSGGDKDITGYSMLKIRASADSTYFYNDDNTKTYGLAAGVDEVIWVGQSSVNKVTVTLEAATAFVQGK